jgi:NADH-quinone oxidoreductase subunit I
MGVIKWAGDMIKGLVTVLIGMKVTLKHLINPKAVITMHYPTDKWDDKLAERFRGLIKCDVGICIVCDQCIKACPVDCITIKWKREEGATGKKCTGFIVDYQKCIFCGLCTDPCPTAAIFHSHDYEVASYSRLDAVIDWAKPENIVKNPKGKPMKPKPKPKPKPAAAKPAAKPAAEAPAKPAAAPEKKDPPAAEGEAPKDPKPTA